MPASAFFRAFLHFRERAYGKEAIIRLFLSNMMLRFISLFVLSEHCVQDGQQFTHTVNQRHFFGFSGCWQMHVKRLYHRIKPGYHKRCHVQGCSCLRTRTGVVRPADMCGITGMLCELNCVLLAGDVY